jgi:hypothetical protein
MRTVLDGIDRRRAQVEAGSHRRREGTAEITFEVDAFVEIRL